MVSDVTSLCCNNLPPPAVQMLKKQMYNKGNERQKSNELAFIDAQDMLGLCT